MTSTKQSVEIPKMITVGDLAAKVSLPVTQLIMELMKNGVMATVNERIDLDTAQIIVDELGLDLELVAKDAETNQPKVKIASKTGQPRPPVVSVMGHVDHGKTSLLDTIRGSEVTKSEAGGITQHISAYQITHKGRKLTFLDTPGHEAFSALRQHGAALTDLAVIVVAADDGVKPQTIEAIRYAKNAGVKIIIAINKIDKPGADSNRVKQQLSEHEVLVEGWGGDVVVLEVSAKTKKGIPELLDMILLVADVEELKADTKKPAKGLVIEAHMEVGRGPVAALLIESGTLKTGDSIVCGPTYAKVRTMQSTDHKEITTAGPATPVIVTGFKILPEFGVEFNAQNNEKSAKEIAAQNVKASQATGGRSNIATSNELIRTMNRERSQAELNIIIKADVQGSLASVADSLRSLSNEEVEARIVGTGIGPVSESDVHLASTSGAIIYGFNVTATTAIKRLASRDKVPIKIYKIIYELIDDAKVELTKLLKPKVVENELGRLIVKAIFKLTKDEVICGGEVTKGTLKIPALASVTRGDTKLGEVQVVALKNGPQDVSSVSTGEMCGVSFNTDKRIDLQVGDRLEFFTRETAQRKL